MTRRLWLSSLLVCACRTPGQPPDDLPANGAPCHTVEQAEPGGGRLLVTGAAVPELFLVSSPNDGLSTAARLEGEPTAKSVAVPARGGEYLLVDAQRTVWWRVRLDGAGAKLYLLTTPPAPSLNQRTGHNTGTFSATAQLDGGLTAQLHLHVSISVAECHGR